jgi:uncharacterized protein (TIGR01319 family)
MSDHIRRIVATDCGSTTTKAILIERNDQDEFRLVARGEAPTTVERPFEDVTLGVLNSITELEEITENHVPEGFAPGRRTLIKDGVVWRQLKNGERTPASESDPLASSDIYLSTSSAGGGLQMMVAGLVKEMSAESAERAALGAGAILMDTLAINDGRKDFQRVERLRQLRPDIILMAGAVDGGNKAQLIEMAEVVKRADPKPRFGDMKLPVIFAGNVAAREDVVKVLGDGIQVQIVDNLRPALDRENLGPAREEIHEMFLEHVMQQAPGYSKLLEWTSEEVMATPNAVGKLLKEYAENEKLNVLGVDIGGATTDVFSVFLAGNGERIYNRTVSANLGMSYSICNVLKEAGVENIARWLPFEIDPAEVRNRLRNKMIRPTTIPQTYEDLLIEHAVSREALRLAFIHHKALARDLVGNAQQRNVGELFNQSSSGSTLVDMLKLDMIIGSGGVLSHAPNRAQSALMLLDAYQPEGITLLTVDSIFMMPHLGVLSEHLYEAARQVFERDCIVKIGTSIVPVGTARVGEPCVRIKAGPIDLSVPFGEVRLQELPPEGIDSLTVEPARSFDVGAGRGKPVTITSVEPKMRMVGGRLGLIVDTRGRPYNLDFKMPGRVESLRKTLEAFHLPAP